MDSIHLLYLYVFIAIVTITTASLPSNEDCEVQGKYNPDTTKEKLIRCHTVVFQDVYLSSNQQLNLLNLNGTTIKFNGIITFAVRYNRIYLMHITGTNVHISASSSAWFHANGQEYYDGKGYYGGKLKPMFAMIEVKNSTLTGLKVLNTPAHAFMIGESYYSDFINFEVDDSFGDVNVIAKNTDGIHILQSSNIRIVGAKIHNQDDCVCITSGCDVKITSITCIGGGFSVGSIGKNRLNTVERVIFGQSTLTHGLYGLLIKAWAGTKGTVDQITFENIVLKDVRQQGIAITQGYTNAGLYSKPIKGVSITNVFMKNIRGNVLEKGQNIMINCAPGGCGNFYWDNVNIVGGERILMRNASAPTELHNGH